MGLQPGGEISSTAVLSRELDLPKRGKEFPKTTGEAESKALACCIWVEASFDANRERYQKELLGSAIPGRSPERPSFDPCRHGL
jgi:hypothetical protein